MLQFINKFAGKSVKTAGLALVLGASAGLAHAQTTSTSGGAAPEIDAGSMVSALTLLTGGLLMITDKFRR